LSVKYDKGIEKVRDAQNEKDRRNEGRARKKGMEMRMDDNDDEGKVLRRNEC